MGFVQSAAPLSENCDKFLSGATINYQGDKLTPFSAVYLNNVNKVERLCRVALAILTKAVWYNLSGRFVVSSFRVANKFVLILFLAWAFWRLINACVSFWFIEQAELMNSLLSATLSLNAREVRKIFLVDWKWQLLPYGSRSQGDRMPLSLNTITIKRPTLSHSLGRILELG